MKRLFPEKVACELFTLIVLMGVSFADSRTYDSRPSSNYITSLSEDRDGYMWMASMHGLNRYDGTSYLTFFASSKEWTLNNDYVYDVCPDAEGDIWVGTKSGINCYRNGSFIVGGNGSPFFDPVIRILDLDENHIVTTGRNGILKLDKGRSSSDGQPSVVAEYTNRNNSWVDLITISGTGDIWYAVTDGGKSSITVLDRELHLRDSIPLPEVDFVHTITSGMNHSVWISTFQNGLMAFDEMSGKRVQVPEAVDKLVGQRGWVQFIEPYGESSCLIGVFGRGMYIYDFRTDTLRHIYPEEEL
ncbi:MAG: hypothetical protein IJ584_06130, partial [Bacteroidales bacterium]|nr:hypothetical protein [Bacteroidales bacterium]